MGALARHLDASRRRKKTKVCGATRSSINKIRSDQNKNHELPDDNGRTEESSGVPWQHAEDALFSWHCTPIRHDSSTVNSTVCARTALSVPSLFLLDNMRNWMGHSVSDRVATTTHQTWGRPSTCETETPYPHGTNTQSVNPSGDRARKGHRKHSITQDDTAHLGQIRTNNFQSTIAPVPSCGVPEDTGASELDRTRLSHSLADIKPEVQRWSEVRQRHVFPCSSAQSRSAWSGRCPSCRIHSPPR